MYPMFIHLIQVHRETYLASQKVCILVYVSFKCVGNIGINIYLENIYLLNLLKLKCTYSRLDFLTIYPYIQSIFF